MFNSYVNYQRVIYMSVYTIYDQPLDDLSLSCHESRSALVPSFHQIQDILVQLGTWRATQMVKSLVDLYRILLDNTGI